MQPAPRLDAASIASLAPDLRAAFLESLSPSEAAYLLADWQFWARPEQLPPEDGAVFWTTWLFLGGRGAGKTRAGAEWIRAAAEHPQAEGLRIALIGETYGDARRVMIDGPSGLIAIAPEGAKPVYKESRRELVWPNGAIAQVFSAEDPNGLRGPQFHLAWGDELGKWRYARETWDMLQLGLRLGSRPRQVMTTTPRPTPLILELMKDERCAVTHATTYRNAANLSESFLAEVSRRYEGSTLGRQELLGEILEEREGALVRRADIDAARITEREALERIIIAVDPPVSSGPSADECGIVVAGRTAAKEIHVLADLSVQGLSPAEWAARVVEAYHRFEADRVVVEVNQGGELVETLLRQIDETLPIRAVRATRGKLVRAEPVAALYEKGRIRHVGHFAALEDQLVTAGGAISRRHCPSDRLDALVWACTDLLLRREERPRLRRL